MKFEILYVSVLTVFFPTLFALSLVPNDESDGFPPLGYEDRILLWTSGDVPDVWFGEQTSNCVSVSAGGDHFLVLYADGSIVAWGDNRYGQCDVPDDVTNAVAVATGETHSLALLGDNTIIAWGNNANGQCEVTEFDAYAGVVAIAAGGYHSLALSSRRFVIAKGDDTYGQCDVPEVVDNIGAIAIAAGRTHSLALLSDGRVAAWGDDTYGQCDVPEAVANIGAIAVAAGASHSLALLTNGTVVAWGDNRNGQISVPNILADKTVVAIGSLGSYGSWATTLEGGLYAWGCGAPPPIPHVSAPALRFLAAAGSDLALTNTAIVRIPCGASIAVDVDSDGFTTFAEQLICNPYPADRDCDDDGFSAGFSVIHDPVPLIAVIDHDRDGESRIYKYDCSTDPQAVPSVNYTLYVDSDVGNDSYDGCSSAFQTGGRGPKATVQQAIEASLSGDVIELRGGAFIHGPDAVS